MADKKNPLGSFQPKKMGQTRDSRGRIEDALNAMKGGVPGSRASAVTAANRQPAQKPAPAKPRMTKPAQKASGQPARQVTPPSTGSQYGDRLRANWTREQTKKESRQANVATKKLGTTGSDIGNAARGDFKRQKDQAAKARQQHDTVNTLRNAFSGAANGASGTYSSRNAQTTARPVDVKPNREPPKAEPKPTAKPAETQTTTATTTATSNKRPAGMSYKEWKTQQDKARKAEQAQNVERAKQRGASGESLRAKGEEKRYVSREEYKAWKTAQDQARKKGK